MGREWENKGEEGLLLGAPKISFISELLSSSILVFEKFTFYKAEENLVITISGVPKVRCIILCVVSHSPN